MTLKGHNNQVMPLYLTKRLPENIIKMSPSIICYVVLKCRNGVKPLLKEQYSKSVNLQYSTLHRGAFCQFSFWCIYYYGSNKSIGKQTGKTHLCALVCQDDGTNDWSTMHLMFFFFIKSCKILCKNALDLLFYFFMNLKK